MNIRSVASLLLFLCLAALCYSCSSPKKEEGGAKLTFWHFWSEPSQKEALKQIIKEFEQQNKCTVELTDLSWNDGKTKLFAAFNSNTAPDVIELGSDWIAQFSSEGVLRNLNADGMKPDRFADFAIPPSQYQGNTYALPWVVDTRVMFYNKTLLRKAGLKDTPPQTMDQLLTDCEQIQRLGDGIFGFGANGADAHRLYKKILPFFWSNGGTVLDAHGKPVINSAQNVQALEMYLALARAGMIETQRQLDNTFMKGQLGFWISGSWLLSKLQKADSTFDYGVMLIPPFPGKNSSSFAGGEYLAINAKAKNPELAKKFAQFMTDGKNALAFCKLVYDAGFPADKQFIHDDYFQSVKYRSVFADQLAHAQMTPVHPKWLDIEEKIENAVEEALLGRKTAQQALDDAQYQVQMLVNKQ